MKKLRWRKVLKTKGFKKKTVNKVVTAYVRGLDVIGYRYYGEIRSAHVMRDYAMYFESIDGKLEND